MNKKLFYICILLILILVLSGCTGGTPTTPGTSAEETKVANATKEFYFASSVQNWDLARSYCVYGSPAYYGVYKLENSVYNFSYYCYNPKINIKFNFSVVSISGNYAQIYGYRILTLYGCGYSDSDEYTGYGTLQKVGNSWKVYS
jgi:hypothetical protein